MDRRAAGLYNLKGKFSYPAPNLGLYLFTEREEDIGKFKAPTLRNIAVTGPYMHDGNIKTLDEVIKHYKSGGRTIRLGPNAGVRSDNANKSGGREKRLATISGIIGND